MSKSTHFFAAHVEEPEELKRLLIREKVPAIIDPCEYEWLGRTRFAHLPDDQRWVMLLTRSDNWERLKGLIEKLVEIEDYKDELDLFGLAVSWNGVEVRGTFYAEPWVEEESTRFAADQLEFLERFFNKDKAQFARYLAWGYAEEFCKAVGIPYIEMVDQDLTIRIPKLDDPAGCVFFAKEMVD